MRRQQHHRVGQARVAARLWRQLTQDGVEREGIERARAMMRQADLVIYVVDASVPQPESVAAACAALPAGRVMVAVTKCDLPPSVPVDVPSELAYVRVSAWTGEGLDALKRGVSEKLGVTEETYGHPIVSLRHVGELRTAVEQSREAFGVGVVGVLMGDQDRRQPGDALESVGEDAGIEENGGLGAGIVGEPRE